MKITYLTKNYKPIDCAARYLKINHNNEVIIVEENIKHYTIKEYILEESEWIEYKEEIKEAKERQHIYPPFIKILEK